MAEDMNSPMQRSQNKVSVAMVTYNQSAFVKQAIESALMQVTEFDYEVVVGEDCSTDGTRGIVLELQKKRPDRIRLMLRARNLGMMSNILQTLRDCQGEYIAYLEGDDYWTDPRKLQKQVDFLEVHKDYVMCFHNTQITYEDGRPSHLRDANAWDTLRSDELVLDYHDLSQPNPCCAGHSSSLVFRNHLISEYPAWLLDSITFDLPLEILLAQHGKARFVNDVMSVHRIHPGGATSSFRGWTALLENRIAMYEALVNTLEPDCALAVEQVLALYRARLGDRYLGRHRWTEAVRVYRQACGTRAAYARLMRFIGGGVLRRAARGASFILGKPRD